MLSELHGNKFTRQQEIANRLKNIYLLRGYSKGKKAWHLVMVDPIKMKFFLKTYHITSIDVSEYGKVLCSGWGENPPKEVLLKIKNFEG